MIVTDIRGGSKVSQMPNKLHFRQHVQ